jgi:hypothetical protein
MKRKFLRADRRVCRSRPQGFRASATLVHTQTQRKKREQGKEVGKLLLSIPSMGFHPKHRRPVLRKKVSGK